MSEQSRHARYSSRQLPRRKRTLPLYGEKDDTGKFYKCWNCGFTCNAERDSLNTGEMGVSGVNTISNLSLLLHMDGTNLSTTITDSSPYGHTVTANGGVYLGTARYKFGTAGANFWSGDYLTIPDHAAFDLSGGYWSVDFWIWLNYAAGGRGIFFQRTDAHNYLSITASDGTSINLSIYDAASEVVALTAPISVSAWKHVEVSEYLNNYRIFIDGKLMASTEDSSRPENYTGNIYIGCTYISGSAANFLSAWLDEFRVIKSAEHLDKTFTVPTEAYDPDTHYAPGHYKPDVSGGCPFCGCTNYR